MNSIFISLIAVFLFLVIPLAISVSFVKYARRVTGYKDFLVHLRRPVGAGFLYLDERLLLVHLDKGPFTGYWFLPSAYFHPEVGDRTTKDTAVRKVREAGVEVGIIADEELTAKGCPLNHLDFNSFAKEMGLVPTEIHIYKCRTLAPMEMISSEGIAWCKLEDIPILSGQIHPLIRQILVQYFGRNEIAKQIPDEKVNVLLRRQELTKQYRMGKLDEGKIPMKEPSSGGDTQNDT